MTERERSDDPRVVVVERSGSSLLPFVIGAAVGAVLGVLLAPRPGAETRRALAHRARTLKERAEGTLEEALGEARRQIDSGFAAARRAMETQAEQVQEVVEASRAAAREARRELRRRRETPAGAEPEGSRRSEP